MMLAEQAHREDVKYQEAAAAEVLPPLPPLPPAELQPPVAAAAANDESPSRTAGGEPSLLPPPPPPPPVPPPPPPGTKPPRRHRPLLLYRTRFKEPSGFSQEAIDFVRGLNEHYYVQYPPPCPPPACPAICCLACSPADCLSRISLSRFIQAPHSHPARAVVCQVALQMEGSTIDGYVKSWAPSLHRMIERGIGREQYVLSRPHTLIHHGAVRLGRNAPWCCCAPRTLNAL